MTTRGLNYRSRLLRQVVIWPTIGLMVELVVNYSSVPRWATLLPLVPMIFFIVALVRTILRMDELQKRICQESAFIAFVLTQILVLVFFGLERLGIAKPRWNDMGACMLLLWAIAYVFTARRYK
ncbi:MAG: hypothetical protein WBV36_18350 [Terriglobales bacterium]|jgi:hypothetical protein